MDTRETEGLLSEVMALLKPFARRGPDERARPADGDLSQTAAELAKAIEEQWRDDPLVRGLLKEFQEKPEIFGPSLSEVLTRKLAEAPEQLERLGRILESAPPQNGMPRKAAAELSELSPELSDDEKEVLKALDHIGGGGSPIDIAVEGMLDIEQTRILAERLWGKGVLLSHRMKDPDAKRFFSFSDMGKRRYQKLLGKTDVKMAAKS
ncbi:hypothetical protein DENIS_4794 [Desulfonema ishimotonii]|uniref:Uncharacterized protein n=1 Tax=Desulfonema ishimotonii TaxID=45657 RepID=A0A401G3K6_9BACT|nr:hypothetical protein [Desulfonema ishimotonii]GBC63796.1 hypothetical protein DENIS_4794 [Desulfonema ishimotonii]